MGFRTNPWYHHLIGLLQAEADQCVKAVCEPLDPENRYSKENREQLIGAAPAFLKLQQVSDAELLRLQEIVTKQTNG